MDARIPELEEAHRVAERDAQLRQEQEQQLRLTLNVLREQQQDHQKRLDEINKSLSAQVQACYTLEAEIREQTAREQELKAQAEELQQTKHQHVQRVEDVEVTLRALEESRLYSERETRRRSEREQQLQAEIDALRAAEVEQLRRIDEAETRLRNQEQARQTAKSKTAQLVEQEEQLEHELATLRAAEQAQIDRLQQIQAEVREQEEAIRGRTSDTQQQAEDAEQRLAELEKLRSSLQSHQRDEQEQQLVAEIEALRITEAEQIARIEEAESQLRAQEQARQAAQARISELADQEQALASELESLRGTEEAQSQRLHQLKARVSEYDDSIRRLTDEAAKESAQAAEFHQLQSAHDGLVELVSEPQTVEINSGAEGAQWSTTQEAEETAAVETPWLQIDLEHSENGDSIQPDAVVVEPLVERAEVTSAPATEPSEVPVLESAPAPTDDGSIPPALLERLNSTASAQRAAALVDLAELGGEEAFGLITNAFDDAGIEVRNAAARALYNLNSDRTASFTRALREASPERRRKIGAAIAGSGLASNALNALSGESRERTYDAYSLLFLMAKVGEVSPLLQAIGRHSNVDVRLTAIKLIALSNQQQVLASLRNVAAREALPPEVHSALMEAIYSISAQAREHAPSLA